MIIWRIIESQRDERVWLAHATTAVTAIAHGAMSNIDDTLLGQRPGGTLHLTCLHSLALWSSVPSFLNDLVFQRGSGVRPRVVACVASPMDSDQYLVCTSESLKELHPIYCIDLGQSQYRPSTQVFKNGCGLRAKYVFCIH